MCDLVSTKNLVGTLLDARHATCSTLQAADQGIQITRIRTVGAVVPARSSEATLKENERQVCYAARRS
jgi:hypothetical protein